MTWADQIAGLPLVSNRISSRRLHGGDELKKYVPLLRMLRELSAAMDDPFCQVVTVRPGGTPRLERANLRQEIEKITEFLDNFLNWHWSTRYLNARNILIAQLRWIIRSRNRQSTFAVTEEQFWEALRQLDKRPNRGDIWVLLTSAAVSLTATGSSIQVYEQGINLLPRPTTHDHQIHTGITFHLPKDHLWMHFERRYCDQTNVRLSIKYKIQLIGGDPRSGDDACLVIATDEEFLVLADSEVQQQ